MWGIPALNHDAARCSRTKYPDSDEWPPICISQSMATVAAFNDNLASASDPGHRGVHLPVRITIPERPNFGTDGFLEDVVAGELSLTTAELVMPPAVIRVEFNGCALSGEVICSRPVFGGYRTNVLVYEVDESGQRMSPRFPVILPSLVYSAAEGKPVAANIIDISADGLGLELDIPLLEGETIAIESSACTTLATVRYSRRVAGNRYRAGVSMNHVMPNVARRAESRWGRGVRANIQSLLGR